MNSIMTRWRAMATLGACLFGIITPFLLEPATAWKNASGSDTKAFTAFSVTILCALFVYAARTWKFSTDQRRCASVVATLLVLTACAYFFYQGLRDAWTVSYYGRNIVIGEELRPEFRGRFGQVRDPSVLVNEVDKTTFEFWERDEVLRRRAILNSIYFLIAALGTATIVFPTRLKQR